MNITQFPAGLNDNGFEIYTVGSDVFALNNGKKISYKEFPDKLLSLIDSVILSRPKTVAALDALKLIDSDSRRIQFIRCNLSNFDYTADVTECLKKLTTEYVNCGIRETCRFQGKLCQGVAAPNGVVSLRELRTMSLIRQGLYDKEICDVLNIAPDTLKSSKKNIQRKYNVERKAMIANVAALHQIIN